MKSLRFVSSAKFSWKGVSPVVSVSGVSLDAAVRVSANSGERLRKGGALSQSEWLTADRSKSLSHNGLRSNPDTSGRLDRLWQASTDATSQKRGESSRPICKVQNCWRRFSNSWCCAVGQRLLLEPLDESLMVGFSCKDSWTAGRTKGVRHTSPGPSKGRGEVRYFAPKGTQGKGGVGRKSKAKGLSAEDSLGSDWSARRREQERDAVTVTVTVNGAVDNERYEGRVVQTVRESNQKCVSNPKYKAL